MKSNADYTRELRELLGPNACIGFNPSIGMVAAFVNDDFNQKPFEMAGDEESLLRFVRERIAEIEPFTEEEITQLYPVETCR